MEENSENETSGSGFESGSEEDISDSEEENNGFDYAAFCGCFGGDSLNDIDTIFENISEEFPQYEITENHKTAVENAYKHINGEE